MPPEIDPPTAISGKTPAIDSLEVRLDGRKHSIRYERGDTLLDAVRRAGLKAPFACQAGNCGTCIAYLGQGKAAMRANNVLSAEEVAEGWVLTCQATPTAPEIIIDYDR